MSVVDWARDLTGLSIADLDAGLAASGPGPGHVFSDAAFTPLPHEPASDGIGATFQGVTLATTSVDLVRALLEGIAIRFELSLARLAPHGIEARVIRSTGGGSRSAWWQQLMADLTGLPVEVVAQDEPGTFGAAILAGVGSGAYDVRQRRLSPDSWRCPAVSSRTRERGARYADVRARLATTPGALNDPATAQPPHHRCHRPGA